MRLAAFLCHNTGGALWGEAVGRFADTCSQRTPFFSILLYAIIFYSATILTIAEYNHDELMYARQIVQINRFCD